MRFSKQMKNKGNGFGILLFRIYKHSLFGNDFYCERHFELSDLRLVSE